VQNNAASGSSPSHLQPLCMYAALACVQLVHFVSSAPFAPKQFGCFTHTSPSQYLSPSHLPTPACWSGRVTGDC
jgi:hypothetical protein